MNPPVGSLRDEEVEWRSAGPRGQSHGCPGVLSMTLELLTWTSVQGRGGLFISFGGWGVTAEEGDGSACGERTERGGRVAFCRPQGAVAWLPRRPEHDVRTAYLDFCPRPGWALHQLRRVGSNGGRRRWIRLWGAYGTRRSSGVLQAPGGSRMAAQAS